MEEKIEQRVCIKFYFKNGFNCADTLRMMQKCFGDGALSQRKTYKWFNRFKDGREDDDGRVGRPKTSKTDENVEKIKEMLNENRNLTIREIAEQMNSSYGSVQSILQNDLGLKRVAAKLVPKELNFIQKLHRVEVAKEMISIAHSDPTFIKRIITGDEMWVYYANDTQPRHHASDEPKISRHFHFTEKVLLTVFIDFNGIVHHEFLPVGQTANGEYYLGVVRRLQEAIHKRRPELWRNN